MGKRPLPADAARAQRAREALAQAKADSRARGHWPAAGDLRAQRAGAGSGTTAGGADTAAGGQQASLGEQRGASRARSRREDPEPIGAAITGLVSSRGWREAAAAGSLAGRWAQIVGADLAAHTRPEGLAGGELTVSADSTAWATQLRLLAAQLVGRLNTELGHGTVVRVRVRGPAAAADPSRRPGQWRVRGSRGPRDTYG